MRLARQLLMDDGRRDVKRMAADEGGQSLILIALFFSLFIAIVGIAVDIAWFQFNVDKMQRAADAGALAGVVYLPGNLAGGQTAATNAVKRNGYENAVNGAVVTAAQEPANDKMLRVSVSSPVRTFFARMFGMANFPGSRYARAEFVLPVPMGSPQNYYGVNRLCDDTQPQVCVNVANASGIGTLAPMGFFGGIEALGTDRQYGDAYSGTYDMYPPNPGGTLNPEFDPKGYTYIASFPAGTVNGSIWVYDPMFCATGAHPNDPYKRLGVGDFWLGNGSGGTGISALYRVLDMQGTPYDPNDDVELGTSGTLFNNMNQVDKGTTYKGNGDYGFGFDGTGSTDCQLSLYHNRWWMLKTGLGPGDYRVQVVTSAVTGATTAQKAVNGFGLEVLSTAGPTPTIHGQSRMSAFIVVNGTSLFYLAQIAAVHAGKTLEIKLFDPGDIPNTSLKIKIPTTTGYTDATFTWVASSASCSAPLSGGPTTSLATNSGSCYYYNDAWLTISVVIPATYTAPTPSSEPAGYGAGWWKIEYSTLGTSADITTWQVNIRGNPVHLVVP